MFFCPQCNLRIGLLFERYINEMGEKNVAEFVKEQEKEGPWKCPQCGTPIEDF